MKDKIFPIVYLLSGTIAFIMFLYGCYWVVKTGSYLLFYESKVKATITEMVRPESLKAE